MLERIRIILVGTSHPGNIGGAARAMKNMGLSDLALVAPRAQFPHPEAEHRATGATDILSQVKCYDTLAEATTDCTLIAGASARNRNMPWPLIKPRALGAQLKATLPNPKAQVALVFGREDRGLSNEELHQCHLHVNIPTNPDFSSLNLAAAVQVLAYEARLALHEDPESQQLPFGTEWDVPFATGEDLERFFVHLEKTLVDIDFHNPNNPRQLMARLRRLYLRAQPDTMELNILRGILSATEKCAAAAPSAHPPGQAEPHGHASTNRHHESGQDHE